MRGSELHLLERLSRRKVPPAEVVTFELARQLAALSYRLGRQIGVLINRRGTVLQVIVGDSGGILIPSLEDHPLGRKALRGLRLVHTHLKDKNLTRDDLTDLALLRLDLIAAIGVREEGQPGAVQLAHLLPQREDRKKIEIMDFPDIGRLAGGLRFDFGEFVSALESEMERQRLFVFDQADKRERAILISVSTRPKYELEESMEELKELGHSSGIAVLGTVIQRLKEINPKYLMGEGKIKDLVIDALDKGATLLVFDQDLGPSQIKSITGLTELKVIDRSQLILDIFAKRAGSREGKVQVELAQLKYLLPRLTGKGTAMSRLMGGIGGRGPGESKLEVDRRRVRDRIHFLERQLKALSLARKQRKHRRVEKGLPIVSIVGYTNAGKSTLLNTLTRSSTAVEDRMFATLDTASRRIRFPRERELIITDTVGFIRDLPKDLMTAFKATLEELEDAALLLHLVDASNPRFQQHIDSVLKILEDLDLSGKPRILVFNKADRIPAEEASALKTRYGAIMISAREPSTLGPLLESLERTVWEEHAGNVV